MVFKMTDRRKSIEFKTGNVERAERMLESSDFWGTLTTQDYHDDPETRGARALWCDIIQRGFYDYVEIKVKEDQQRGWWRKLGSQYAETNRKNYKRSEFDFSY